jgi:hypothetical protein
MLDGDYVQKRIAHGYAITVHAAKGVTADTMHAVLNENNGRAMFYVAIARSCESNTAYLHERMEASEYIDVGTDGHVKPDHKLDVIVDLPSRMITTSGMQGDLARFWRLVLPLLAISLTPRGWGLT